MKITTRISHVTKEHEIIRGHELTDLIAGRSFTEAAYLVLRGTLPSKEHAKMFDAILVAAIDHGAAPPSPLTARLVASAGNDAHVALAAGILAQGNLHGGAIEGAARFFLAHFEETDVPGLVARKKAEGVRIPGFGHRLLKEDRRSAAIFAKAREMGMFGKYCAFASSIEKALAGASKAVPLNVDGAMAATLLEMGFAPSQMRGIFALARLPGLIAHSAEQAEAPGNPLRLSGDEIVYEGS